MLIPGRGGNLCRHKNIAHTARYTALSAAAFKGLWENLRAATPVVRGKSGDLGEFGYDPEEGGIEP